MANACALCGLMYERAQGYWVGAIYVNYAVTTVIAVTGFLLTWRDVPMAVELAVWGVFVVVLHPWLMNWGSTSAEQAMALPRRYGAALELLHAGDHN